MKTSDFDYTLPPELIAQTPIEPRDASRLMVLDRSTGEIVHRTFHDILEFLRPGDLLVGNDSRVIPRGCTGSSRRAGRWRSSCCGRASTAQAVGRVGNPSYRCGRAMGMPRRRQGAAAGRAVQVQSEGRDGSITATILAETESGGRVVAFDPPVQRVAVGRR